MTDEIVKKLSFGYSTNNKATTIGLRKGIDGRWYHLQNSKDGFFVEIDQRGSCGMV